MTPTVAAPARLPLRRPVTGRWIGGVCAGVAAHLGLSVGLVRLITVLLVFVAGSGPVLYVFLWLTVPVGDPYRAATEEKPATLTRLAPRLRAPERRVPVTDIGLGLLLVAAAVVAVLARSGASIDYGWVIPTLILLAGAALAWSQIDTSQRDRWIARSGGRTPVSVLRLLGGVLLVAVGVLLLVGQDESVTMMTRSAVAALAVLAGVALVAAPWWLRLVREVGDQRAAAARESERADIAAHLHDSVLQTLALIRSQADRPEEVARLARAQERELRSWLYDDRTTPGTSLAADLAGVVGEVEDAAAVAIESVVVGDAVPDADTAALLQATREALINATRHGRPPVTVYLEVGPETIEVFVRDKGDGFDLDAVPADRFGVRESIIGRVRRRGGTATVTAKGSGGTEVHLAMPRAVDPRDGEPERRNGERETNR